MEGPAVLSPVDKLSLVVLPCRRNHFQAHPNQGLLVPLVELGRSQRCPSLQVHRQPVGRVAQPGAVEPYRHFSNISVEGPHRVRQRGHDVGEVPEHVEGVVVAEHRYVVGSSRVVNWKRRTEQEAAIIKAVGQGDGIGVKRRDDVSARGEILSAKQLERTGHDYHRPREFAGSLHCRYLAGRTILLRLNPRWLVRSRSLYFSIARWDGLGTSW